jgi:hypothetical protein
MNAPTAPINGHGNTCFLQRSHLLTLATGCADGIRWWYRRDEYDPEADSLIVLPPKFP